MAKKSEELDPRYWPSCRYGPNGDWAIFDRPEDVPEGWEDHPSKVKDSGDGKIDI